MALFTKAPEKNLNIQLTTMLQGPAASELRAYFARGSKISGKISFEGPARIDGEVDGEINAKDSLTIGESAIVTANIHAAAVSVAGKVSGDIVATQRIEILHSAKVSGNITASMLSVQDGALLEGLCSIKDISGDRHKERVSHPAGGQKQT
jgi:cytoskeletal protein CcmA (bactofilin family)